MKLTNEAATALQKLAQTTDQLRLGTRIQAQQATAARAAGATWASIGKMLGCSAQAAYNRYGSKVRTRVNQADALW